MTLTLKVPQVGQYMWNSYDKYGPCDDGEMCENKKMVEDEEALLLLKEYDKANNLDS